jgi:flagellar biosynthetic protein FliR/FlhB
MSEDSDKTEEPSEHKLQEARKKGNIFKSQDAIQTVLLLAISSILFVERTHLCKVIVDLAHWSWNLINPDLDLASRNMFLDGLQVVVAYFMIMAPIFVVGMIAALGVNMAQVKFIFSFEPMQPKLSKINPIEGFKRIFSVKSFVEFLKQVAKLGVVTWVCIVVVKAQILSLKMSVMWDLATTLALIKGMTVKIVTYVVTAMMVISVLDYIFQEKQYMKQMKMSIKELKDEYKDTEGNPQVKGKIRQLMRQSAQARMQGQAANATAVVSNPTHLAVALRYEPGKDEAPMVVAKGENLFAQQIKIIAEDHDIPIIENVELARALFAACEIESAIPVDLYKATAEVLAYVFRLKKKRDLMKKKRFMAGRSRAFAGR